MTVAHTLSVTTYHVINNNKILHKLQEELGSVTTEAQGQAKWKNLEQLLYLASPNLIYNPIPSAPTSIDCEPDCGDYRRLEVSISHSSRVFEFHYMKKETKLLSIELY